MIFPIFLAFLIPISKSQNPFSEDIITLHNNMRSAHTLREEFGLKTATNMRKMKWNESLIHRGDNEHVSFIHNSREDFTPSQFIRSLWEPIKSELVKLANFPKLNLTQELWDMNPVMRFAIQMIWAEASQVGCVIQKNISPGSFLYCVYDVPVKPKTLIYETGVTCSKCGSMGMQCELSSGLCFS